MQRESYIRRGLRPSEALSLFCSSISSASVFACPPASSSFFPGLEVLLLEDALPLNLSACDPDLLEEDDDLVRSRGGDLLGVLARRVRLDDGDRERERDLCLPLPWRGGVELEGERGRLRRGGGELDGERGRGRCVGDFERERDREHERRLWRLGGDLDVDLDLDRELDLGPAPRLLDSPSLRRGGAAGCSEEDASGTATCSACSCIAACACSSRRSSSSRRLTRRGRRLSRSRTSRLAMRGSMMSLTRSLCRHSSTNSSMWDMVMFPSLPMTLILR
jgi:hypothetical protein